MVVHLINAGINRLGLAQRRLWVQAGQPVIIAPRLVLRIEMVTQDGNRAPVAIVEGPTVRHELPVNDAEVIDLSRWAGMFLIPRAHEHPARGTGRFFLEFVSVREDVKFA